MLKGNILTVDGWIYGSVQAENGRVTSLDGVRVDPATNDAPYILPGFVDLHVHGGGGADIMEGGDAAHTVARLHAKHGTTSLLATTMTAPRDELMAVVAGLGEQSRRRAARWCPRARCASRRSLYQSRQARCATGRGRRCRARRSAEVFVAGTDPRGHDRPGNLRAHGSDHGDGGAPACGYNWAIRSVPTTDAVNALKHGARGLYPTCSTQCRRSHHRDPGMVGAALAHAEYAELIPDLLHVHPGAILRGAALDPAACMWSPDSTLGLPACPMANIGWAAST